MSASSREEPPRGWYRRFVERLDPGDRVGELLFGLIMVLTFTLGAGIELGDREETRELLFAALGCNAAWGIIDAALYLMARLSERGRLYRVVKTIQQTTDPEQARALVERELDERLPEIVRPEVRASFATHVFERVREMKLQPTSVTAEELWAALAVFWLVFLTALPAVVPFVLIREPNIAMRVSNAMLIGLLFYTGWRWAAFPGARRFRTGLFMALLGVALVIVAIALGG